MWLKLDAQGMKIELQITGYKQSYKDDWDTNWCSVDFSFVFSNCINYSKVNDEVMLSCEVDELEKIIDDFINDKFQEKKYIEFVEPDFNFMFVPSYNMVDAREWEYAAPGHEMSTPTMEWRINLWSGGLTDNFFSTTFGKDSLKVIRDYLRLVMRKLDKNSPEIKRYVDAGMIYGQI